jgi:hypothetical protein
MIHKQFTVTCREGRIKIEVDLEYYGDTLSVVDIRLISDFDSSLPDSAEWGYDERDNSWKLCKYHYGNGGNDQWTLNTEWLVSSLAKAIAESITILIEMETFSFEE